MKKILLFLLSLLVSCNTFAYTLKDDPKYCGFVPRTANGEIKRSSTELRKFQLIHPCPSTGLTTGECPGWDIDHVLPLAIGGCDLVGNMQWLPNKIKTCTDPWCKDRFERQIHQVPIETPGFKPLCCTYKLFNFE